MTQALRYTLLSLRDLLVSVGPFVLFAVLMLGGAYWWLNPNPPKHVTLATGPAQSAYATFGQRYAKALAKDGITVELLPSEGSADNLRLLKEGKADLGFVQGGTAEAGALDEADLESLGSLFLEPVWLFYREAAAPSDTTPPQTLDSLTQLQGLRVNVGTPGSGIPNLMGKLLESNRIDATALTLMQLEQTPATVALLAGELDAIVFASAPESSLVQMLLQTPGIKLMDFAMSEAYSRRFSFLSAVVLPRGVVDLAANVPPRNLRLVAPTTTLLTREGTHPALVQLFALAGNSIHGGPGWFKHAREFPNIKNNELPLAQEAERSIQGGAPLLQRYLPFWVANLVERMWLVMGIILAVLLPLSRMIPPLYAFRIRSRIFRWYAQLRELEARAEEAGNTAPLLNELNELDRLAEKIRVPLSYTDELYALRNNIQLVRKKLQRSTAR
ncbi:MAG: ABC transporter substrate-binding protein [Burkholderiales bacterium]|nr:ABC transporter substrate-binding protein [Burkholderiales bacterium]